MLMHNIGDIIFSSNFLFYIYLFKYYNYLHKGISIQRGAQAQWRVSTAWKAVFDELSETTRHKQSLIRLYRLITTILLVLKKNSWFTCMCVGIPRRATRADNWWVPFSFWYFCVFLGVSV